MGITLPSLILAHTGYHSELHHIHMHTLAGRIFSVFPLIYHLPTLPPPFFTTRFVAPLLPLMRLQLWELWSHHLQFNPGNVTRDVCCPSTLDRSSNMLLIVLNAVMHCSLFHIVICKTSPPTHTCEHHFTTQMA